LYADPETVHKVIVLTTIQPLAGSVQYLLAKIIHSASFKVHSLSKPQNTFKAGLEALGSTPNEKKQTNNAAAKPSRSNR
jgi:hypothetical protein